MEGLSPGPTEVLPTVFRSEAHRESTVAASDDAGYSDLDDGEPDDDSSDGELDWDPDRERLLRTMRHQSSGEVAASRSGGSAAVVAPPTSNSSAKSLAERRNEWRASRGLARQKTVAEILAERRAAREEGRANGVAPPTGFDGPGAYELDKFYVKAYRRAAVSVRS